MNIRGYPSYWKWLGSIFTTALKFAVSGKWIKVFWSSPFELFILGVGAFAACLLAGNKDALPFWTLILTIPACFFLITHGVFRLIAWESEVAGPKENYLKWLRGFLFECVGFVLSSKWLKSPYTEAFGGFIITFTACFLTMSGQHHSALLPLWTLGISIPVLLFFLSHGSYRLWILISKEEVEVKNEAA